MIYDDRYFCRVDIGYVVSTAQNALTTAAGNQDADGGFESRR